MSSQKFNEFEKAFEQHEVYQGNIYELVEATEDWNDRELPFGGKLIAELDEESYDSYGSEDSVLKRVIYFEEFGINVMFYGTRQSYSGTEWDGYKEVQEKTKVVKSWE